MDYSLYHTQEESRKYADNARSLGVSCRVILKD